MRTPRATATITAALALACALVLAGCTGDEEPQEPESTWIPTSTPEAPSTTPAATPTRPALPDEAKKPTPAGARAFIRHYWDLTNYAEQTGRVGPLRAVSAATCERCLHGIRMIQRHYRDGGRVTGGGYDVTFSSVEELPSEEAYALRARLTVRSAPQTITNPDGSTKESSGGTSSWQYYVIWTADAWRLDVIEMLS